MHRRAGMSRRIRSIVLLAFAAGCGSSTAPTPSLRVDVTVNGAPLGSVSCGGAITVATSATNVSSQPIQLQRLAVRFIPRDGQCTAHDAGISGDLSAVLAPGATLDLRRFDAAGTLCNEPTGRVGCTWTATALLLTSAGTVTGQAAFSTYRPPVVDGCDVPAPRLLAPANGAVVSGVVDVRAELVESAYCVISARTIVEAFGADGAPAFVSFPLDLGDHYPWDTRRVRNGAYWLSAYQSCCRARGASIVVTVQN
jgi:hypothetical protein